jgi:hypothetical protein
MPKQIKWAYQIVEWNPSDVVTFILRENFNDVNPLLLKIVRLRAEWHSDNGIIYYPVGVKNLDRLPGIGSTDRWTRHDRTFEGEEGVGPAIDHVVSFLDNLDPQEAFYAKVMVNCSGNYITHTEKVEVSIFVPEGAK